MIKFEVGREYTTRSSCDHNCTWTFKVVGRTAKTITLEEVGCQAFFKGQAKRFKVIDQMSNWRKAECIFPLGMYSMAPVLAADNFR